jgi:hypothetical protein
MKCQIHGTELEIDYVDVAGVYYTCRVCGTQNKVE